MLRFISVFLTITLYFLTNSNAQSVRQFCVNCKSPDRSYLCSVKHDGIAADTALGLHCVIRLSKTKGHQSCSVSKTDPDICEGTRVSYKYKERKSSDQAGNSRILPGGTRKNASEDSYEIDDSKARSERRKKVNARKRKKEPKTLIEFGDKVAKDTSKTIDKTGKAISKATKKTFKCIGSLFSKC